MIRAIWRRVQNKTIVGRDGHGNEFYTVPDAHTGTLRRGVDYAGGDDEAGVELVPQEWRSWLGYHRDGVPSQAEVARREQAMADMRARVERLEEEDSKLRLQEEMGGLYGYEGAEGADAGRGGRYLDDVLRISGEGADGRPAAPEPPTDVVGWGEEPK